MGKTTEYLGLYEPYDSDFYDVDRDQNENFTILDNKAKEVDETIKGLGNTKQDKQDNALQTDAKEIVPAINEIKELAGNGGEKVPIGSIVAFSSDIIPLGYLLCDGREIKRNDYPELYALLKDKNGKRYLPDLRDRVFLGKHNNKVIGNGYAIGLTDGVDNYGFISSTYTPSGHAVNPLGISKKYFAKELNLESTSYSDRNVTDRKLGLSKENSGMEVDFNSAKVYSFMIKAINVKQESIDELAIDELNKKIEANRVAINNHEYEVQQEFNRRDEVVTLWSGEIASGTVTLKENYNNFKMLEIESGVQGVKAIFILNPENVDLSTQYVIPYGVSGYIQLTFQENGLNVTVTKIKGGNSLYRITGIGRVNK